ncbi:hypothetical protein LguiB_010578 [Lonicera macranthoides]
MDEIHNAVVVHFNGNMKPWIDIAMNQFRPLWTKNVDYENDEDLIYIACKTIWLLGMIKKGFGSKDDDDGGGGRGGVGRIFPNVIDREDYHTIFSVFGVRNVASYLQRVPEDRLFEAISSYLLEATARIENPVRGCTALLASFEQKVEELQARHLCIPVLDPEMAKFENGLNWKVVDLEIFFKMDSKIA